MHSQNEIKTKEFQSNDLSFLKKELKDVKVVMLGEITHNDGNVFELKNKIIEYLYKELGFKTIAFESGTYEVWKAQQEIQDGKDIKKAFQNSLFTIWSKANEFQSFISFYKKTKDLKIYGFDNQITGEYGENNLIDDLYNYCKNEKLILNLNKEDFELLIESMLNSEVFDEKDISYTSFNSSMNNLITQISKKKNDKKNFYWKQIIENLITFAQEYHNNKPSLISSFNTSKDDNQRDKMMAKNLLSYIKQNPNEKIICWGANQHFSNNITSIKKDTIKEFIPMGSYIKRKMKNKMYSLAIITAEDSIKLASKWYKTPIKKTSFEWYLKQKKQPNIFISSNQKALDTIMLNRFFSPITFIEANLSQLHDGYIFLDKAIPSTFFSEKLNSFNSIKNKISGLVIDSESKKEIPFASIVVKDSYIGTSANENGFFELYIPNSTQNKSVKISSIGYQSKTIEAKKIKSKIELNPETTILDEVIIHSKRKVTAKTIIENIIKNFEKNYPTYHYNSDYYGNAQIQIDNKKVIDFDIVSDYYDRGYNSNYRPTLKIKEIRWNTKRNKNISKIRHFFTIYNSIVNLRFISQPRKIKKFEFNIEKEEKYQGTEIYIISFKTDRNHFNYTNQIPLSRYSGFLYVNKKDFSIIKTIEKWKIEDSQNNVEYQDKKFYNETKLNRRTEIYSECNFRKSNGTYFLEKNIYKEKGYVLNKKNEELSFQKMLNVFWYNIDTKNVKEIRFKKENDKFNSVKYNKDFWNNYVFPNKFKKNTFANNGYK